MKFKDITILAKPLVLVTHNEVNALQSRLWIQFTKNYLEYVSQIGEGILSGLIRIYPPRRIEKELGEWRQRIKKYWFWEAAADLLPKDRALECVIFGDTINGDELVFHPSRPEHIFILPADDNKIFDSGADLLSALEWICTSGKLVETVSEREFQPFDSRVHEVSGHKDAEIVDPEGESLDEIVELAERWALRHSAKKLALAAIKKSVPKGSTWDIRQERFVIRAKSLLNVGYESEWNVIEKSKGREVGVFRWHKNADSEGSEFEPA